MGMMTTDRKPLKILKFKDLSPGQAFRFAYPDGMLSVGRFFKIDDDKFYGDAGRTRSMSTPDAPRTDDVVLM